MGKNNELGLEGEQLARDYLEQNAWHICACNYRYRRSEIDLIASKNDLMIFVEVKTRTNTAFGMPEEFVNENKVENIHKAAVQYIIDIAWQGQIRFDIIAIVRKSTTEITHFEDAF
ncbi:MAG: YraN family protein [Cyclobacteriaceae bacterium]|nr:YraN family protein [Cyclobacteriaceae bacterium]